MSTLHILIAIAALISVASAIVALKLLDKLRPSILLIGVPLVGGVLLAASKADIHADYREQPNPKVDIHRIWLSEVERLRSNGQD